MNEQLECDIVAAMCGAASPAEITALVAAVERELSTQEAVVAELRRQALTPYVLADDGAKRMAEVNRAVFARDRAAEALRRLTEKFKTVKEAHAQARLRAGYEAAVEERDALAAELASVYPEIEVTLADLLARIDANDKVIERINARHLPKGGETIKPAEVVARDLPGFRDNSGYIPRITEELRLPAFRYKAGEAYVWPRSHGMR